MLTATHFNSPDKLQAIIWFANGIQYEIDAHTLNVGGKTKDTDSSIHQNTYPGLGESITGKLENYEIRGRTLHETLNSRHLLQRNLFLSDVLLMSNHWLLQTNT